jgi:hypothetical protein
VLKKLLNLIDYYEMALGNRLRIYISSQTNRYFFKLIISTECINEIFKYLYKNIPTCLAVFSGLLKYVHALEVSPCVIFERLVNKKAALSSGLVIRLIYAGTIAAPGLCRPLVR